MSQLRRALGLPTVVSTSTGLAFAAIEYLVAASLLTYVVGPFAPLAIGVAGLLMLLVWGYYSELNGLYPTAAAMRLYMSRSMDDRLALIITFTYLSTIVLVVAADAYIIGNAIAYVLGGIAWLAFVWIAVLLGLATYVNLRGIRVAGRVQDIATYTVIGGTILFGLLGIFTNVQRPIITPPADISVLSFLNAVALAVFLYSAFEWVTTSAEEVRSPELISRGMLITIGILFVTCSLITYAMSQFLTSTELASAYPQLFLAEKLAGQIGVGLMLGITAITAINTFNGAFITASRFIYAVAREGILPARFAMLNDKAVPYLPVIALGVTSLIVAILVAISGAWQVLVATGAALEALIYAVAAYCVFQLRNRLPQQDRPFRMIAAKPFAIIGIIIFGILGIIASVTVRNEFNPTPLLLIVLASLLATAYVLIIVPRLRKAEAARQAARGSSRRRPQRPVETNEEK